MCRAGSDRKLAALLLELLVGHRTTVVQHEQPGVAYDVASLVEGRSPGHSLVVLEPVQPTTHFLRTSASGLAHGRPDELQRVVPVRGVDIRRLAVLRAEGAHEAGDLRLGGLRVEAGLRE